MIIREARTGDAGAIAAVLNPVIRETAVTFTTAEKTPETLAQEIAARQTEGKAYLVAEQDGEILGFATYFQFRGGPGYVRTMEHTIVLDPAAQGRGVGRALMAGLEEHARAAGVHSLWAGVSAENPAGLQFHLKVGFTRIARLPEVGHKSGRYMDLILLQKIL